MRLLEHVVIQDTLESGCILELSQKVKKVKKEQEYILKALLCGVENDEEMVLHIMEQEKIDRAAAGFALAEFIIDYAFFLENDRSHYEIID